MGNFDEAVKKAAVNVERNRRIEAEKNRAAEARQRQAADLLAKLGRDVAATCRARNTPFWGLVKVNWHDRPILGESVSFTLIDRVWMLGEYQVTVNGEISMYAGEVDFRHMTSYRLERYKKAKQKALGRFTVVDFTTSSNPLRPVADIRAHNESTGFEVGVGPDGLLYREGVRAPLVNVLASALAELEHKG